MSIFLSVLRVGVTKYCKLQGKKLPATANGLGDDPRPLNNTVRAPTAKDCLGNHISLGKEKPMRQGPFER